MEAYNRTRILKEREYLLTIDRGPESDDVKLDRLCEHIDATEEINSMEQTFRGKLMKQVAAKEALLPKEV